MAEPFKLNPLPVYDEHYAATQEDEEDDDVCPECQVKRLEAEEE